MAAIHLNQIFPAPSKTGVSVQYSPVFPILKAPFRQRRHQQPGLPEQFHFHCKRFKTGSATLSGDKFRIH
jgi:hypothetical protein